MKYVPLTFLLGIAFGAGLLVSSASATSYPGNYAKVFGNSTSCALGRASASNSSDRGGAFTANFQGCSSSNARRSVPANYLGSRAYVLRVSNGALCGVSALYFNTSTASSRDASTPRTSYANGCDVPGNFVGNADNYRRSDAGGLYLREDRLSPSVYFNSYLI